MVKRNIVKSTDSALAPALEAFNYQRVQRKKTSLGEGAERPHTNEVTHQARSYPGFRSIKQVGLLLSHEWEADPSQDYLQY